MTPLRPVDEGTVDPVAFGYPGDMTRRSLARWHGAFAMVSGIWPLVHMRSFEAVLGPKTDLWLVRTVAGLLLANGLAMVLAPPDRGGQSTARRVGVGTAATLACVDLVYVARGRISRMYLLDAAAELAWIACWVAAPTGAADRPADGTVDRGQDPAARPVRR